MKIIKKISYNKYFTVFCLIHLLLWTLLPTLVRHNLPLDVVEGFAWGQEWQMGYYKHPWLAPWFTIIFGHFGGSSGWTLYLLSQLAVISCFWAVWQLAKQFLSSPSSLFSVLLLEGICYYNFTSPEFNPNVILLPLWALTVLYFYQALNNQKLGAWIKTGIFLGLSMMGKYYSVYLFLSMLLFLVMDHKARDSFKSSGIYIAALIVLAVVLPNTVWLFKHNLIALTYILERTKSITHYSGHVLNPLKFLASQLVAILLALVLFLGAKKSNEITNIKKKFIMFMGISPLALVLLTSFLTGMQLHSMYGTPLFSYLGIMLLINRYEICVDRIKPFLITFGGLTIFWVLLYISFNPVAPYLTKNDNCGIFPGREISEQLTTNWHLMTHKPLCYIVGSTWLAGNIAYYSEDHPHVYFLAEPTYNPWVNDKIVKNKGALFVWKLGDQPNFESLKSRFPNLKFLGTQIFSWKTGANLPPIKILVGLVAPSGFSGKAEQR